MLIVKNLNKQYHEKQALQDISMSIEEGKIYGLFGNNGAGKTTLLNCIAQKMHPNQGELYFEGHGISKQDLDSIAYFPDHSLFDEQETVEKIVAKYQYFFADFDREEARHIMTSINISYSEKLGKMSAGERKKCELAFVLARKAKLFLLDEPFAQLDPLVRMEIMQMIVANTHEHASYIISTHQVAEVESYMDETLLLMDGSLILCGNNDSLRKQYQCTISDILMQKLRGGKKIEKIIDV